ncbi:DUF6794 domain-containing protein [Methylomonas sp. AM2-LC]|uniref:DUF6794 domain-containing protein n=1 Tax=Methylomonas sp. AM2-LC TaxID=3153301 RepID=UPI003265D249
MYKKWSAVDSEIAPPTTIDSAVDRLLIILTDEDKSKISSIDQDNLINLHFGLGTMIRNAFGLHESDSALIASCNHLNADDVSMIIIKQLWQRLQESRHDHY